jgi:uncharacterized protein (TIGR03790 family)
MRLHPYYLVMSAALTGICGVVDAQPLNQRVLVVYNSQSQASLDVANYYMNKRSIPAENLCAIAPRDPAGITLAEYYSTVRDPIRACLNGAKASQILYIVMSYLTPYDLSASNSPYSIDSFLSDLWDQYTTQVFNPVPTALHDYYADAQSQGNVYVPFTSLAAWRAQPGAKLLYSVWRLDAATQSLAQGLVDSALAAEAAGGPSGVACFDARSDVLVGLPDFGYYQGDWDVYRASTFLQAAGFSTVLDTNGVEFGTPPAPNCPGAAIYSGWYSLNNYNDAFTWNTGAIGFHLDSFSAGNPRGGPNWSANALMRGITTTAGAVWEPFLEGLPRPGGLYRNLLEGANVGDAFVRNTRWLKWMIINIGDPLYTPFPGGRAPFNPPAPEASLALSSMQVVGGHNLTATVSLAAVAPAGGTTVTLASSMPSVATVPASVQISAGSRTATFPVTTAIVTDENGVTVGIGANTGSGNLANTLAVYPLLGGLQLSQSTVNGGQALTGTVFLNDAAPSGGVTISLTSSDPSATVPQFVSVPVGQSQMDFQIATSAVGTNTLVTISASYAGATATASLTVSGAGAPPTSTITTAPVGLMLTVDSATCTSPCMVQWMPGSSHSIAVTVSPQAGPTGTQYLFANWSDSGAQSHSIVAPSTATTYTANFSTQYFLTTAASPAAGGAITPASGWYAGGAVVTVSAIANNGYQFGGFTGALSGTTTPQNLTITAPASVTATFNNIAGSGWYGGGAWPNRRKITIDHTKVLGGGSLAGFPMLVSISDAELKSLGNGGKVGRSDGTDILFTDVDGVSKLSHELESYNGNSGSVVAWVRIPILGTTTDTGIYVYYGNASAADQQNKVGVWDANYKLVNHFKDPSGTLFDSTQYGNNGTASGGAVFNSVGAMGGAYSFDGATGLVTIPYSATWNGSFSNYTVQMWIKMGTPQDFAGALAVGGWGSSFNWWFYSNGTGDLRMDTTAGSCDMWPAQVPLDNAFHQLVLSYDAGISTLTAYVDGVVASYPRTCTGPLAMPAANLTVGGFNGGHYLQSTVDELRISANATRSAAWIATEYNNQKSPGTFYSVGATETNGSASVATITSAPAGLSLTVDGSACTAPCSFQWVAGSNHTIAVTSSPQAGPPGSQYVFANWSDGGAQSHTINAASSPATYTANFSTQYFLTTSASPAAGGTIAPGSGWYASGAVVGVSATANSGYQFSGFTGALSGTTTPQNLTMTAAATVTANFTVPLSAITVTSAPAGLSLTVDGGACTAPCSFQWPAGSNHTIAVTASAQAGGPGIQYVFANWSDGGAQSHTISAPSPAATYTANFSTQYFLTTTANPSAGGSITPASGWYASGAVVSVSATANTGYQFSGFTGALSGTTTPQNLTMAAASTVTANFTVSGGTGWYNPAWANRRKLTINHAQVSGSLTNFPMLVSITDPELRPIGGGGKVGKSDGTDILFTAADGISKLNHELESYNAATGSVVAWVQIASLNNAADGVAYLYYGNGSATDQQNKVAVWDANYKLVSHFKDASGTLFDSTQYGNNGTASGGAVFTSVGAMGGAYRFDGASGLVTIPYSATWNGSFNNYTVQMWIKMGAPQDFAGALAVGGWGSSFNWWFYSNGTGDLRMDTTAGACDMWPAQVPLDNAFHQLALTYDAGISTLTAYVDGVVASYPRTCTGPLAMPAGNLSVGGFSGSHYLQSTIDELRISANATRSGAWIATEYNNQKSPGTFYSVGATETNGTSSGITIASAPAGLSLTVDGSACTAPCAFQWTAGSNHTIAVTVSPQAGGPGIQYVFGNWSDGGAQSHTISAPSSAATYTANFTTQYFLTTSASPAAGGAIAPASGWYASGTVVGVSATANTGYQFAGFTGALSGTTTPQNLTIAAASTVTANFSSSGGTSWYNPAWTNRRKLTVNHARVSGSLTNFPMLVSITDPELKTVGNGGKVGKSDGTDILFTAADGISKLNHEMESYNAATGSLVAWVQIPSLNNAADSAAYLYYGNASALDQQNKVGVWDANYKLVNHFKDASGTLFDSTQYGNNGTASGGAVFTSVGAMGGAYSFDGATGLVTIPYSATWNGSFSNYTVQMWIKMGTPQDFAGALAVGGWGSSFNWWFYSNGTGDLRMDTTAGSCDMWPAQVPLDNAFHQLVLTYDAGISSLTGYVDGVANYPRTCTGSLALPAGSLSVGGFSGSHYLQSTIDELRISANATRSAAWIATEYNSQKSPATFYSVGASESFH